MNAQASLIFVLNSKWRQCKKEKRAKWVYGDILYPTNLILHCNLFPGNGNVTSTEFVTEWMYKDLGPIQEAVQLFLNLDVNDDTVLNEAIDMPWIFKWFDRNGIYSICQIHSCIKC